MIADLYENREGQTIAGRENVVVNPTVRALIAPFRVWKV
jgi:hypothetical protein